MTNWTASVGEDVAVIAGLWTALNYPLLFIVLLAVFIALAVWLMPKIWRGIKTVFGKVRGWVSGTPSASARERDERDPQ